MKISYMSHKIFLFLFIASCFVFAGRNGEMKVTIYLSDPIKTEQLIALNLKGDIHRTAGVALLYVTDMELKQIERIGLKYTIDIPDVNDYYANRFYSDNPDFRSSDNIISSMNSLVSTYPSICAKYVFGKSVNGKELSALKISDSVSRDEPESEVLFDGGIHGNETGGPDLLVRFAKYLCDNYGKDQSVTDLVNNREIWFFCMVNPDGRPNKRENANNQDLNRNYGYMASNGFSQPETKAMRNCLLSNQFTINISYHQGIEFLLYPWCFSASATPDKAIHSALCNLYSTTSGYYPASKNVQSNADVPTTGETIDYAYGVMGTASLTMEISSAQSSLTDSYYGYNQPAMLKMMQYAGYGIEGIITDAVSGTAVAANITVNSFVPFYSDPLVGDYHKYLPAGTYSLKVMANGYVTQNISNVVVASEKSTVTNIKMERDGEMKTIYGYKVVLAEAGTGKTWDLLGPSDSKTYAGNVVIDMQYSIPDISGNEIKVYPTTGTFTCSASDSIDGPWKALGTGSAFDLSKGSLTKARYLKFTGATAIDAVEASYNNGTPIVVPEASALNKLQYSIVRTTGGYLLNVRSTSSYTVSLFDIQGKLLWEKANVSQNHPLNLPPQASGLRFISLTTKQGIATSGTFFVK